MEADDYQRQAARTLSDVATQGFTTAEIQVVERTVEFAIKVAGLCEYVKKSILHRHGFDYSSFRDYLDAADAADIALNGAVNDFSGSDSSEIFQDGDRVSNLWNSIGILGESGELVEAILDPESSDQKILKESGDVSWYNAMLLHRAFLSFGTALEINILRLKERYPEKFSTADSIARRDVKKDVGDD